MTSWQLILIVDSNFVSEIVCINEWTNEWIFVEWNLCELSKSKEIHATIILNLEFCDLSLINHVFVYKWNVFGEAVKEKGHIALH